jgi:cholesterol transport system auxiliary component
MIRSGLLCICLLLGACLSQPHTPEPALYDLGVAPATSAIPARTNTDPAAVHVSVSARSWLDHTAMHYRLLYTDEHRMMSYAYARWIAPPAELVGQRLRQKLAEGGGAARTVSAHEIAIELEEYVQVFETPTQSFGRVTVHVRLPQASNVHARFTEQATAPTLDAAGGVRALAAATDAVVARIVDWAGAGGEQEAQTQQQAAHPGVK